MTSPRHALTVVVTLLLSIAGMVISTDVAAHAVTWPAPSNLSSTGANANEQQVVVAPDGTATAAWLRAGTVEVSTRPAGGSWSASQPVSEAGNASVPQIGVGPDGAVTVVWNRYDSGSSTYNIYGSTRAPGGSWQSAVNISQASGTNDPEIGIGPNGTTVVVWQQAAPSSTYLVEGAVRPAGGAWQAAQPLSATSPYAGDAHVAVASDGTATAVWAWRNGAGHYVVQSASHAPGGIWASQQTLSDATHDSDSARVAVGPDGSATAVWRIYNGTQDVIQTASRPSGGAWSAAAPLSETTQESGSPQIAIGPDNVATAVWRHYNASTTNYVIQTATRPAGGSWTAGSNLSVPGQNAGQNAGQPQISTAPNGTAVATWSRANDSGTTSVQFSSRPANGSWQTAVDVSEIPYNADAPQVAVGADGTTAVVWARSNGTNTIVQAVTADNAFAKPKPAPTPPAPPVPNTGPIKGPKTLARPKVAAFTFTGTAGSTYQCRLDKAKAWRACRSPYKLKTKKLKAGKHVLYVRAVLNGVPDPTPSAKKFKVR